MSDKKSPITEQPLRQAGQSISEKLQHIFLDKIFSYYFVASVLVVIAAVEWAQYWTDAKPNPWLFTIPAVGFSAYALFRIVGELKTIRNYKLGRDGEKVVGEYLDRLVANGYRVFHDIPGDGWNIDHVIVSSRGVFTIETKTRSKPITGKPLVVFDGKSVSVDGYAKDEGPIRQSLAQSKQLRKILKESTGYDFPIRPVVLFPGWYVQRETGSNKADVWVLNPTALYKWIDNGEESIPVDRVKQAATAISKYVRGFSI